MDMSSVAGDMEDGMSNAESGVFFLKSDVGKELL